MQKKRKLAVTLAVFAMTSLSFFAGYSTGRLTTQKNVANDANVVVSVNLSVWNDTVPSGTQLVSISWGTILPTQSLAYILWVIEGVLPDPLGFLKEIFVMVQAWLPSDLAELFLEELKTSIDLVLRGSQ